jgi:hypothetical protein
LGSYRATFLPPRLIGTRVAHEAAALFFEATAIEVPAANCRPSKLSHDLRELAICTRSTLSLWHLETIEPRVAAHAL